DVAERVQLGGLELHLALDRVSALGDHDDRRVAGAEAGLHVLADAVDVERLLRDEDHVGAAGHAGVQRDPSGVTAHDLADEGPVVGLRGGVQPVDGLGGDVDRGVEAEGVVGARQVVVDRLGHADDLDVTVGQLLGDAKSVLAADRDQRVDAGGREVLLDAVDAVLDLERVRPRRAQDGATARQDAPDGLDVQGHRLALQGTPPAVTEADELVTVDAHPLTDDASDHGVQTGAVAASGQDSYTHGGFLPTWFTTRIALCPPRRALV